MAQQNATVVDTALLEKVRIESNEAPGWEHAARRVEKELRDETDPVILENKAKFLTLIKTRQMESAAHLDSVLPSTAVESQSEAQVLQLYKEGNKVVIKGFEERRKSLDKLSLPDQIELFKNKQYVSKIQEDELSRLSASESSKEALRRAMVTDLDPKLWPNVTSVIDKKANDLPKNATSEQFLDEMIQTRNTLTGLINSHRFAAIVEQANTPTTGQGVER